MRIVREDGVLGLFRGGGPTVVRAMALNMVRKQAVSHGMMAQLSATAFAHASVRCLPLFELHKKRQTPNILPPPAGPHCMPHMQGMLASNDQAKEMIEAAGFEKGGSAAVLGGSMIAGVLRPRRAGGRDFWQQLQQQCWLLHDMLPLQPPLPAQPEP